MERLPAPRVPMAESDLGILLDCKLHLNLHIDKIIAKALYNLNII